MAAARMKNESVKNVSACDWSNLVGRLTGKISRAIVSLALDSNLCGCLKQSCVLKVTGLCGQTRHLHLSTSWGSKRR